MKATVDKYKCIGCGVCAAECPSVFTMTDDNLAAVTAALVPAEDKEHCSLAAANCPVEAITLTD